MRFGFLYVLVALGGAEARAGCPAEFAKLNIPWLEVTIARGARVAEAVAQSGELFTNRGFAKTQKMSGDRNLGILYGKYAGQSAVLKIEAEKVNTELPQATIALLRKSYELARKVGGPRLKQIGLTRAPDGSVHVFSVMEDIRSPGSLGNFKELATFEQTEICALILAKGERSRNLITDVADFYVRCLEQHVLPPKDIDWMIDKTGIRPLDVEGYSVLNHLSLGLFQERLLKDRSVLAQLSSVDPVIQAETSRQFQKIFEERMNNSYTDPELSKQLLKNP